MTTHTSLRERLARPGIVIAPGAYDAIGAGLIEQAGFEAVYMTGAGTSMARGFPDFGLLDMGEMVGNAATMARSITVPLIADADTGYGNELNVTRTVREYESRGVAAIHIEDQVSPKRCGHLDGKEVVSRDAFVSKISAAVEARRSKDFLVIARTDARAVHGLDDAIARANAALSVGADIAFVEAPQSMDEVAQIPRRVEGPCPAERGAQRQDAGIRSSRGRGHGLPPGDPSRAVDHLDDRRCRPGACRIESDPFAACRERQRRAKLPPLRRGRMGCAARIRGNRTPTGIHAIRRFMHRPNSGFHSASCECPAPPRFTSHDDPATIDCAA